MTNVAVLGSLNLDVAFSCKALPAAGETVLSSAVISGPGGKGLNQAVAARRAGAAVVMAGAVGTDSNGEFLLSFLEDEGIDIDPIIRVKDAPTGLAHIMVDETGENAIVVASGANKSKLSILPEAGAPLASVYLTQLEVEIDAATAFLKQGRFSGARTILNAAPALPEARSIFEHADIVIANEHELAQFSALPCHDGEEALITEAARKIVHRADQIIIVTLGAQGTQIIDLTSSFRVAARPVQGVDTTGAGDCFCGVLAASIAAGSTVADAVERANRAASLAVQRVGAAAIMPLASEIALA